MKKSLMLMAAAALLTGAAFAGDIAAEQARTVAENFVAKDSIGMRVLPGRTVDTVAKRGGLWLVTLKPSGHLLVSANCAAEPIPAFSENDFFEPEVGSPQSVLLALAETNAINATGTKYEMRWRTLLGERVLRLTMSSAGEAAYIAPLLQSAWSQDAPYYDYAPANPGAKSGTHDPNGCVSTAYSQIMRYWEWPEKVDEDIATEHLADSAWGFKQQLWAGTKLNWSDMPLSWYSTEADRMNVGRATMLCGMIAKMSYAGGASAAQNSDVTRNPWYTTPKGVDNVSGNSEELKAAIKASLKANCPFIVGINNPAHSIVGDGCSESAGTFYVHLNYGWGGTSTQSYTLEYLLDTLVLNSIYPSQRPNPMVQVDSMNAESALPLTLGWSFPKKGYEDALNGFTIKYAEVGTTVSEWSDDFSDGQGVVSGEDIMVTTLDCNNTTPVLCISKEARPSHCTWPAKFVRADSVLSFRIRSKCARGMKVQVQAYNPSTGWEDVCVPTLADDETIDWQSVSVPLAKYADKVIGLRVKALRISKQSIAGGDDTGVQLDDFKITNVRGISSSIEAVEVGKDARSYSFTSSQLSEGRSYVFTVEPKVAGGIASPSVSTKIVSAVPAVASIDAITSVRKTGYQVQQGFCREGYLGLNQFGVYGSDATTGLVVRLSHPVLIDKSKPYFDTVDQKYGVTIGATSVVHAVSVEKSRNGKFLVNLDFSMLTEYAKSTRMMVTFDALDAKGNVARKHFNLLLNNLGGETAITIGQLQDFGGSAPDPEPVYYTVAFNANGGTGGEQRQIPSGSTVGSFPAVSWAGHTLDGWYTQATGGTRVYASQAITADATYYAHWLTDITPDEPVNPPGGEEPVVDPTDGNPNDFTEGNVNYRFCNGVSKTNGFFDVHRTGTYNTMPPISYNLIYWWVGRYDTAFGSNPSGYVAPNENSMESSDKDLSIAGYTATLLNSALAATLPSGTERVKYFPADNVTAASWIGSAQGDNRAVQVGRYVYAALAKGPIGFKAHTSSQKFYCGVIWGCEYSSDDTGRYATKFWVTDTRSKNDGIKAFIFDNCSNTYGEMPGLKDFNGSGNHGVIEYYYPIVGPAISEDEPDEPGDDPVIPTMFTVQFESAGAPAAASVTVASGAAVGKLPTVEREGWNFRGWQTAAGEEVTEKTAVTADVTFYAQWEKIAEEPDEPDEPTPDEPVVPGDDGKVGVAANSNDPGKFYTAFSYTMNDNYWTARKLAIQQRKQLFVLSGAAWCSNCSFVKDYLNSKATEVSANFIVYFSDHDSTTCNYFNGGLPQYGAADPRTVDAFTGTLNGSKRSWDLAWQKATSGIYVQDRGGYAPEWVQTVIDTGVGKAKIGSPTNLVIRGLATLATGHPGKYELYAQFDDGVEMPVDHGVTWSVVSGNGDIAEAGVEGKDIGKLTINAGSVTIKAESKFYFTGFRTMKVSGADIANVKSVTILSDSVNLEDDATPLLDAIATMNDDSTIPVAGFGNWSAQFKSRLPREDSDLEEDNQNPDISFDENSRLVYAPTNGKLAVCDQKIDVTLELNGKTTTKEVTVWGPTKVAPSKWKMISGPRQTKLGVVRLQCTELKYNYGGKIHKTTDTYFASYKTVLKFDSGTREETTLRGLTAISTSGRDENCKVGLSATKVNGKFAGYSPADPIASAQATNFTNVAEGSAVDGIAECEVPQGFFRAFFPNAGASDYAALAGQDSDEDGFKNWEEYVLGTDPTNPSDAFTLMQGYQHLTAPAANGDTMQYKVMYQQRARRIYYIEAKKAWDEAWTQVAKVSLANMEEADVTKFTELNANYADNAMFFRVRAALYEHEFNHVSDYPKIETMMLVANRGAVIDLSDGTALDLSSFDTDATDPGTVWVKVAANAAPGTTLIRAPKTAEKSLKACRPHGRTDIAFEVVEESGKLALVVGPAIEGGDASVVIEGDKVVVTPNDGITEITLSNVGEKQVEIPSSVVKVGGVGDCKMLTVKSGSHDVTKAMKFTTADGGFVIGLDEAAVVTVGGEEIPVRPVLADGDGETPFEVKDGQLVFKVKTIPGLKYEVLASDSLDPGSFGSTAVGLDASSSRCELKVGQPSGKTQGFYKIQVSR